MSDVAEVEKVLQTYFDGLYEGNTQKLGQAFHPASHLYSVGADGKPAKVAIIAVARKLLVLANSLIKHDKLYDPEYSPHTTIH